ncbi:TetR/AcrR family transcriptional regulator [Streptomyces tubbatahanensis]|uniref:TetR/AcrR family transcriptional regulator n=1 Tax=Streptomyces tubbatahanensis TaxID=2923272 RepID=A0ABY3XZS6_9ACTN|nr:TetR family transcriptional regulator [Streptomyces tubbatahanensis]UNT00048.1 TetR/AcrR family transcriptional regulator [Streptomyces tubbatahanensis]
MSESPSGLRERKRQRTYQAISDAAVSLFLAKGFDAVSVSEIADAAEVSKPTLFRYFPAKEDMALHRFADHEDEAARVVAARAPGAAPLGALEAHFLAGLDARDPVTGLCDDPEVLAFHRLLYGTPSLVARLHSYTARSEAALAAELAGAADGSDDGPSNGSADSSGDGPSDEPAHGSAHGSGTGRAALTARLAAGQIITTQRVLALENWRRVSRGASAERCLVTARADAVHAFALLRTGLAPYA